MVRDVNDHFPIFDPISPVLISERTSLGFSLMVQARDGDGSTLSSSNRELQFSLSDNTTFSISNFSPVSTHVYYNIHIVLHQPLEYDGPNATRFYSLGITATDSGSPQLNATSYLNISILDYNDNLPSFTNNNIAKSVPENTTVGSTAFTIEEAFDLDSGRNAQLTYHIVERFTQPSFCEGRYSILTGTNQVILNEAVDKEDNEPSCSIVVEATDGGVPRLSGQATYITTVTDINEHAPVFVNDSLRVSIPESFMSGQYVTRLLSTNPDQYPVNYTSVEGASTDFVIEPSGHVTVAENVTLDRERTDTYVITVDATETGVVPSLTGRGALIITITDVNDNAPLFNSSEYRVSLRESHQVFHPPILTIAATDADIPPNNIISYSFIENFENQTDYDTFRLDSTSGVITLVRSLDYDNGQRFYYLRVQASDDVWTSETEVSVRVLESNDNPPQLVLLDTSPVIPENATDGSIVTQVQAFDNDTGINREIYFSLADPSEYFAINSSTGDIYVQGSGQLDFESQIHQYQVMVVATDMAGTDTSFAEGTDEFGEEPFIDPVDRPLTDVRTLTITITDVNDNAPVFDAIQPVSIAESLSTGSIIASVRAQDLDSGRNGEAEFHFRSESSAFSIDPVTGVVTLSRQLDFDDINTTTSYSLEIIANDLGSPQMTSTALLNITILDVNDNAPYFINSTVEKFLPQNTSVGTTVFLIAEAFDVDSGSNAALTYSLLDVHPPVCELYYSLNESSNEIVLREELDAGTVSCTLFVQVTDGGEPTHTAQATYIVTVTDVDDNAPVFVNSTLVASIPENSAPGHLITQLLSTNPDDYPVVYRSHGGANSNFVIMSDGRVIVAENATLDYESVRQYILWVEAVQSNSMHPLRVRGTLIVNITDENDNAPQFNASEYTITVTETHPVSRSSVLLTVWATDEDSAPNNVISYSFLVNSEDQTNYNTFGIDSASGEIYLTSSLDYDEGPQSYNLRVAASDGVSSSAVNLSVQVLDSNDNSPEFHFPATIPLMENATDGGFVLHALASDRDHGINGDILYTLSDPSGKFVINSTSGVISVNGSNQFDFESGVLLFQMTVTASDRAGSVSYGSGSGDRPVDLPIAIVNRVSQDLTVVITDVNDNRPVFLIPTGYSATIYQSSDVQSSVLTVLARDADQPNTANSEIRYRIQSITCLFTSQCIDGGVFEINSMTGTIYANGEMHGNYVISVEAFDNGVPSLSSAVNVTVAVMGQPMFVQPRYTGIIYENSARGSPVLIPPLDDSTCTAWHLMISVVQPNNSDTSFDVTYSLFGSLNLFEIDPHSGAVTASVVNIDRESLQNITFQVRAHYAQGLYVDASVFVVIADRNDEAPVFEQDSYTFRVSENAQPGLLVHAVVSATDRDLGANSLTIYSISDGPHAFEIDAYTGVLSVTNSLCLHGRGSVNVSLNVTASDALNDSLHNTVPLQIEIFEENLHSPTFNQTSFIRNINRDAPVGTEVLSGLTTMDQDLCSGPPFYDIVSGNINASFAIDSSTGRVTVNRPLESHIAGFTLLLRATDIGNFDADLSLSSNISLTVLVDQLLPVSVSVDGGYTVPPLTRGNSTCPEHYEQQLWIHNGGSALSASPVVTYTLGNSVANVTIPRSVPHATSITGTVLQTQIYRDDPYVRVAIQVEGEQFEKASLPPTNVTVIITSPSFPEQYEGACVTSPPSATCITTVRIPQILFNTATNASVRCGLGGDSTVRDTGVVELVPAKTCQITSRQYVSVSVPQRVFYPGDYITVEMEFNTEYETDYFSVTFEVSSELEFDSVRKSIAAFAISSASRGDTFVVSGLYSGEPALTNLQGQYNFSISVRLRVSPDVRLSGTSFRNISATVSYVVDGRGQLSLANVPAHHLHIGSRQGEICSTFGQVEVVEKVIVRVFTFSPTASLLNTAALNGENVSLTLNTVTVYNSGESVTNAQGLTWSSMNTSILQVESDCSRVFLSAPEQTQGGVALIRVSDGSSVFETSFVVWYPHTVSILLEATELRPVETIYDMSRGRCDQAYESASVDVQAIFSDGINTQLVSVLPLVADLLDTSDSSVLQIVRRSHRVTVRGISPGVATVVFNQYSSDPVRVTSEPVTITGISLSLHAGLAPGQLTSSSPGTEYLHTAILGIDSCSNNLYSTLDVTAQAVLSNYRVFELTVNNGFQLWSENCDIIAAVYGYQFTVQGSGMTEIVSSINRSTCDGPLLNWRESIVIEISPVSSVEVIVGNQVLSLPNCSQVLSVPSATSISVELVHEDGTRTSVAATDPNITIIHGHMLSVDSGVVSLSEIAGSGLKNITVQYTQGETTVTSEPVILEIVGISGVTMTASAYPQQGATSSNDILIERFRETNVYQQLILSLTALLSNGTSVDVTEFTNFTTTSEHVYLTGNVVTATEQGTAVVTGTLGCLATADLTVQVLDQEVSVVAIPTLSLPLSHGTLSGFTNQSHHPNVTLLMSDGTEYPHFLTRSGPAVPGLLQFSVDTDAVVVDSQTGEVTLSKNSLYLTTLVASSGAVSSSISFQTDLLPSVGEVDVEGFSSNQTAGNFDVDIYLNAEDSVVSLIELLVHYDPVVLEPLAIPGSTLPDVVSGRDLPNCKLSVTSYKHRDFVRLGYVFPEPVLGSPRMHVATLQFELLSPALPANFSFGVTAVMVLSNFSAISASVPSPPSVFGSPSLDPAQLKVSQCPSPPCSTQQCSHMTMLLVPGDANGDCALNLLDAYFTLQMFQLLSLSDEHGLSSNQLRAMDTDFNGVTNEADVRLLAEASLGLYPLVTELVVRPIDAEHSDCVLTILLTLKSQYGTDIHDTYVFFGIFHNDPIFEMQYDNTNLDIGMKVNTLTPPGVHGGWIEAANTGNGSFTLRTAIGPIAQTDIGLVVVYGTPTTSGVVLAERTLTLTGAPVIRPTYREYSATFSPIVGQSFSLPFYDFEPLVRFNNSFSGLACMNNHPPVIDPRLQGRIVITQNETVSIGVIKMDRISVTDEDFGQSGSVRFSLENLSEPDTLSIDPLTGNIIVSESLDREAYESIRGEIVATDQGPQMFTRLSDSIAFELILQDINDNPPVTERAVYNVTVSEDIVVPSGGESVSVLNITGQDRDVSSTNRGFSILRVTESYSTSPSQTFKLRAKEDGTNFTLSLHLTAPLDHRVQDSYVLTILLVDVGHPNLNSSAVVNVEVVMSSSVPTLSDAITIAIIVAICGLVLLLLLALACLCYCRRSSRKRISSKTKKAQDSDPFIERNALEMDQELTVASNPSDKDTFWYDNSVKSNPVALEDPSTPH